MTPPQIVLYAFIGGVLAFLVIAGICLVLVARWIRQAPRPDNPLKSPTYRAAPPYRNGVNGTAEKEHRTQ